MIYSYRAGVKINFLIHSPLNSYKKPCIIIHYLMLMFHDEVASIFYGNKVVTPSGGYSPTLLGGIGDGNKLILQRQPFRTKTRRNSKTRLVFSNSVYDPSKSLCLRGPTTNDNVFFLHPKIQFYDDH